MTSPLSAAIAQQISRGAVMRIGTITSVAAGYATVTISGSATLVNASYLVGSYFPILGEQVAVVKDGSQWVIIGAISAPPKDNPVVNYSFEEDAAGTVVAPTGWNFYLNTGTAPTVTIYEPPLHVAVDGPRVLRVFHDQSFTAMITSSPIPVNPGEVWTADCFARGLENYPMTLVESSIFLAWFANAADLYPTTVAPDTLLDAVNVVPTWIRLQTNTGTFGGASVPDGTRFMRVGLFTRGAAAAAGGLGTYWFDRVVARRIG